MVNDDSDESMHRLESHATFAGPGASRPSNRAAFPPTVSASAVNQERSDFTARSGMEEAMVETVLDCDLSKAAIASAGVAASLVAVRGGTKDERDEKEWMEGILFTRNKSAPKADMGLLDPIMVTIVATEGGRYFVRVLLFVVFFVELTDVKLLAGQAAVGVRLERSHDALDTRRHHVGIVQYALSIPPSCVCLK